MEHNVEARLLDSFPCGTNVFHEVWIASGNETALTSIPNTNLFFQACGKQGKMVLTRPILLMAKSNRDPFENRWTDE